MRKDVDVNSVRSFHYFALTLVAKVGKSSPVRFKYRDVAPATGAQTLKIGTVSAEGGFGLYAVSQSGGATIQGQA